MNGIIDFLNLDQVVLDNEFTHTIVQFHLYQMQNRWHAFKTNSVGETNPVTVRFVLAYRKQVSQTFA